MEKMIYGGLLLIAVSYILLREVYWMFNPEKKKAWVQKRRNKRLQRRAKKRAFRRQNALDVEDLKAITGLQSVEEARANKAKNAEKYKRELRGDRLDELREYRGRVRIRFNPFGESDDDGWNNRDFSGGGNGNDF